MASVPDRIVAAVALALVVPGVVLVGLGLTVVPDLANTEYHHRVEPADADAVPAATPGETSVESDAAVYAFADLSPDARSAFLTALNDSDDHHAVTGDRRAPEFTYDSDLETVQYVRYEGSYYAVWTNEEDRLGEAIGLFALLAGLVPTLVGALLWRRVRRRDGD